MSFQGHTAGWKSPALTWGAHEKHVGGFYRTLNEVQGQSSGEDKKNCFVTFFQIFKVRGTTAKYVEEMI